MPANELKPCPFCGGKGNLTQCSKHPPHDNLFMPGCADCEFEMHCGPIGIGWIKGRDKAAEVWNRRHSQEVGRG